MIVLCVLKKDFELGGYMVFYQFFVIFYEVCFNYFFCVCIEKDGGDLVYFQGYIFLGVYVCVFLEGCLIEEQMDNFCQEVYGKGLFFYLYLKLMLEFWQFLIVFMGLGLLGVIYQVKFLKYLEYCGLKDIFE